MISWAAFLIFLQILLIDIAMAGDNAILIGITASHLPKSQRFKAVRAGLILATLLRIIFAVLTMHLLHIPGLQAMGGLILIAISWKMVHDLRKNRPETSKLAAGEERPPGAFGAAMAQIVIADISMALDNVLAVAGAAEDNVVALVAGQVVAVLLMGAASFVIARLIERYPWISYVGIAVILYTAIHMIIKGWPSFLSLF